MFYQPPSNASTVDEFFENRDLDDMNDHLVIMVGQWRGRGLPEELILSFLLYHDDFRSGRLDGPLN